MINLNINQTFGKFASETPEERMARAIYNDGQQEFINAADNNVRFKSLKELGRKFNATGDAAEQARAATEMFSRVMENYTASRAPKFKKIALAVASAYPNFNRD